MKNETSRALHEQCLALLQPAGFKLRDPEDIDNSYWWEKLLPDGSMLSITYGDTEGAGRPASLRWSISCATPTGGFDFSTGTTLNAVLEAAVEFENQHQ
jgi:hypothetical protein